MRFNMPNSIVLVCALFCILLQTSTNALADNLRDQINKLAVLPLHYGVNELEIGKKAVLIIKGDFNTESASGGDAYAVLVRENTEGKPDNWKMVRYEGPPFNKMLTVTAPHTGEDSIMSVRFLVSKGVSSGNVFSDLYLLKAEKVFPPKMESLAGNHAANFTLYKLSRNDDFGIFYLHQVAEDRSKGKYCNVDWAMFKELAVALPDNSGQYECTSGK